MVVVVARVTVMAARAVATVAAATAAVARVAAVTVTAVAAVTVMAVDRNCIVSNKQNRVDQSKCRNWFCRLNTPRDLQDCTKRSSFVMVRVR